MTNPLLSPEHLIRLREAFRELKAEQDQSLRQAERRTFVYTHVYRQVRDERKCLLIGRKGAGKTAMLVGYRNENSEEYLAEADIDIIADEFPLEPLFNFFYVDVFKRFNKKDAKRTSDLAQFVDPTKVATYAWKQSLVASAVCMAASKMLDDPAFSNRLSEDERNALESACEQVLHLYDRNAKRASIANGGALLSSLLVYNVGTLTEVIETIFEEAAGSWASAIAKVAARIGSMAKTDTTEALRKPTQQIRQILQRHNKKVLLTLDRFDDFYDEFLYRHEKDDYIAEKREFLASLLKGLVIAARDLQRDTANFHWMHMIFTIPMDKFLELHLRERADLESNHVVRLEWTPKELYEMVNRRIAFALQLPEKEINGAWRTLFPFDVGNARVKEVKEDSFLYIVRHSLWNPREIQMYLKALFAALETQPANEETFRKVVRGETEQIIRREFIGQFIGEYSGLQKMLNKLGNVQLKTVMRYEDLCDKLSGVELFDGCRTSDETLLRLFHMGVVGVRANARRDHGTKAVITQQKQEITYRYCFNCDESDPFSPHCEVCFHPMFFEYLNLKHEEPYVVNQLSWEMFV